MTMFCGEHECNFFMCAHNVDRFLSALRNLLFNIPIRAVLILLLMASLFDLSVLCSEYMFCVLALFEYKFVYKEKNTRIPF